MDDSITRYSRTTIKGKVMSDILIRIIASMFLVLASSVALAAGSLAIDTLQGKEYGFSFNHATFALSDERAKRECGSDCSVIENFENQCAAFAADQTTGSNVYGWSQGASDTIVQQRALSECRNHGGSSCIVRAWGCDTMKATDKKTAALKSSKPTNPVFTMLGEWEVDYATTEGDIANGTLRVNKRVGNGVFGGVLVLSTEIDGQTIRNQQDALITVEGKTVTVNCSNPVYLVGGDGYHYEPDNYTLTIANNNVLKGINKDSAGAGGIIVLIKK